jgi:hypothetical protein
MFDNTYILCNINDFIEGGGGEVEKERWKEEEIELKYYF